jgi:hypothetical protein
MVPCAPSVTRVYTHRSTVLWDVLVARHREVVCSVDIVPRPLCGQVFRLEVCAGTNKVVVAVVVAAVVVSTERRWWQRCGEGGGGGG